MGTYAFGPLDTCCEKDTDITIFIVVDLCGVPKCREGEVIN